MEHFFIFQCFLHFLPSGLKSITIIMVWKQEWNGSGRTNVMLETPCSPSRLKPLYSCLFSGSLFHSTNLTGVKFLLFHTVNVFLLALNPFLYSHCHSLFALECIFMTSKLKINLCLLSGAQTWTEIKCVDSLFSIERNSLLLHTYSYSSPLVLLAVIYQSQWVSTQKTQHQ